MPGPESQPSVKEETKGLAEILKEQLALIALLLLLSGTVYADSYYAQFGIKLSSLGFSSSYLIYRACTVVIDHPWVSLPYLLSLLWFGFDEIVIRTRPGLRSLRTVAAYLALVLVIAFSYVAASRVGVSRANN